MSGSTGWEIALPGGAGAGVLRAAAWSTTGVFDDAGASAALLVGIAAIEAVDCAQRLGAAKAGGFSLFARVRHLLGGLTFSCSRHDGTELQILGQCFARKNSVPAILPEELLESTTDQARTFCVKIARRARRKDTTRRRR